MLRPTVQLGGAKTFNANARTKKLSLSNAGAGRICVSFRFCFPAWTLPKIFPVWPRVCLSWFILGRILVTSIRLWDSLAELTFGSIKSRIDSFFHVKKDIHIVHHAWCFWMILAPKYVFRRVFNFARVISGKRTCRSFHILRHGRLKTGWPPAKSPQLIQEIAQAKKI